MEVQICFTTYKLIENAWLCQGPTARRGGGTAGPIRPWTLERLKLTMVKIELYLKYFEA